MEGFEPRAWLLGGSLSQLGSPVTPSYSPPDSPGLESPPEASLSEGLNDGPLNPAKRWLLMMLEQSISPLGSPGTPCGSPPLSPCRLGNKVSPFELEPRFDDDDDLLARSDEDLKFALCTS